MITAVLRRSDLEGGVTYLEAADGVRYQPRWPPGWRVEQRTGALSGPGGEPVVAVGTAITVRGEPAPGVVSVGQLGPVLDVAEVLAILR